MTEDVSGLILESIVEWFEHRIDDGPIDVAINVPWRDVIGNVSGAISRR